MRARALAVLLVLAGAACLPPAKPDPTEFFLLTVAPVEKRAERPKVELADVEVPDYLKNPRMAARTGGNEVDFAEFERWAEPLDKGVARALRECLAPAADARPAPAPGAAYKLSVRVLAFEGIRAEGAGAGKAFVKLAWELRGPDGKSRRREFEAAPSGWDGKDYARLAALESESLAGLCRKVRDALP